MKTFSAKTLVAFCVALILAPAAIAKDVQGKVTAVSPSTSEWVEITDPAQLRAIFSNKTLTGEGITTPLSFVGHYSADGKGVVIIGGQTIPRTWAVKGNWVCVTTAVGTECWIFWRNRNDRNEIKSTRLSDRWTYKAKVENWIPKF